MALVFDAAADRALRTTGVLDFNAPYAWMGYFKVTADTGGLQTFMVIGDGGTDNYDFFGVLANRRLFLEIAGSVYGFNQGTTLSLNTWYHVAGIRTSDTNVDIYLDGVLDFSVTDGDISGRGATPSRIEVGGWRTANAAPLSGYAALLRAWSDNFSGGNVATEMASTTAVRSTNLYADWQTPTGSTRLDDFSGNARHFTEGGTLTDTDNPIGGAADIVGTLSVTQAANTLSSTATADIVGTLSATQAANTLSSTGAVDIVGVLSVTQADNTLSSSESPLVPEVEYDALEVDARNLLLTTEPRQPLWTVTDRDALDSHTIETRVSVLTAAPRNRELKV